MNPRLMPIALLGIFLFSSLGASEKVRGFLNTGNWYPADPVQLNRLLDSLFAGAAAEKLDGRLRAIISPHAALAYSGRCAAKAYQYLENAKWIKRIILLGPSHQGNFYGACLTDDDRFATPLGEIAVDRTTVSALARHDLFHTAPTIMAYEHSLENQLPFIQRMLGSSGYTIVPILFGSLQPEDFAAAAEAIGRCLDANTLLVVSSDLTHYGANFNYLPFSDNIEKNLDKLDHGLIDQILKLDAGALWRYFQKTRITACGIVPIAVLLTLLHNQHCQAKLVDYYKSGDQSGDYSLSVSYASLIFSQPPQPAKASGPAPEPQKKEETGGPVVLTAGEEKTLLAIARRTLADYLTTGQPPAFDQTPYLLTDNLRKELGVFVTLRERGELRGCIGTIVGTRPLHLGVAENAIHAAVNDPRFPPLEKKELERVNIEISVMTPLQKIADWHRIRLGTDGVIIRDGFSQAVFLPQVATETGWPLDEFLGQLCLKAGLPANRYRESPAMEFYIFQARIFAEKENRK